MMRPFPMSLTKFTRHTRGRVSTRKLHLDTIFSNNTIRVPLALLISKDQLADMAPPVRNPPFKQPTLNVIRTPLQQISTNQSSKSKEQSPKAKEQSPKAKDSMSTGENQSSKVYDHQRNLQSRPSDVGIPIPASRREPPTPPHTMTMPPQLPSGESSKQFLRDTDNGITYAILVQSHQNPPATSHKDKGKATAMAATADSSNASPSRPTTPIGALVDTQVIQEKPDVTFAKTRQLLREAWKPSGSSTQCDRPQLMRRIMAIDGAVCPTGEKGLMERYRDAENVPNVTGQDQEAITYDFIAATSYFICQLDDHLMDALIDGDLPLQWKLKRPRIRQCAKRYVINTKNFSLIQEVPYIYINYLVQRDTWEGVDVAHVIQACEYLQALTEHDLSQEGEEILKNLNRTWFNVRRMRNQTTVTDLFAAFRVHSDDSDPMISRQHYIPYIRQWLSSTREIIAAQDSQGVLSLSEVGFSAAAGYTRLANHKNLAPTSTIMLVLVTCALHMAAPQTYNMEQFVVAYPDTRSNCMMAESIITTLTSSYIKCGGLNYAAAGNNEGSIRNFTAADWDKIGSKLEKEGILDLQQSNSEKLLADYDDEDDDGDRQDVINKQAAINDELRHIGAYAKICEEIDQMDSQLVEVRERRQNLEQELKEVQEQCRRQLDEVNQVDEERERKFKTLVELYSILTDFIAKYGTAEHGQ